MRGVHARLLTLAALLLGTGHALAGPAPVDAVAAEAADQRRALAIAERQKGEAEAAARRLDQRAGDAQSAADADAARVAALALRIQAAEADLAAARASLALVEGAARAQAQRLAAERQPIAELLAAQQLLARRPPLSLFVEPGTTTDIVHARAMMEAVLPAIRARTASLEVEVARSNRLAAVRRRALAELDARRATLADRRQALAQSEAASRARAVELAGNAGLEGDRALALGQDAEDIAGLLSGVEEASSVRDALMRLPGPVARPGSGVDDRGQGIAAPASGQPAYRLPVIGRVVTGLGEVDKDGARSRGLTLAVAPGAQVVAPAAGRIVYAGPFRTFGRIVIIDHGGGWTSLITHLAALNTRVGDTVAQGSPIGRTGPEEPRIGVELRRAGVPVDIATLVS